MPDLIGLKKISRLDWWGIGLLVVDIGSLKYVLKEGDAPDRFDSTEITVFFFIALAAIAAFIWGAL